MKCSIIQYYLLICETTMPLRGIMQSEKSQTQRAYIHSMIEFIQNFRKGRIVMTENCIVIANASNRGLSEAMEMF